MKRSFILHLKNGNKVITEADAFREAEKQEKAGKSRDFSALCMARRQNRRTDHAAGVACMVNVCGWCWRRLSQE